MIDSSNYPAVVVRRLRKRYKEGTEATRGIDLTVAHGEAISILGPNGAGKTTFLRQLTTELKPSDGTIEIFGIDAVRKPGQVKAMMGITPQEAGLFETLTVGEHLGYFGRLKGLSKADSRSETSRIIESLDLVDSRKKRIGELSIGQRRRVLIGLSLMGDPPLLILDEPTTGLDPASRRTVWRLLREVTAAGTTLIFSTHYIEEAENISGRAAFINEGRIVAIGTLHELRQKFPQRYRMMTSDGANNRKTVFFETLSEMQEYLRDAGPTEFQIMSSSLEDVYFSLVGESNETARGEAGNDDS